jgi:NhaA family Na+:H+ antiporter
LVLAQPCRPGPRSAFLKTETGSGLILGLSALAAVIWANSPWASAYDALTQHAVPVRVGPFAQEMSVAGWVKTALMPVFFFVVGLEIKYEIVRGELSNPRRLALPVLAAAGGLIVPALVYLAINAAAPGGLLAGWPTPTATTSPSPGGAGRRRPRLPPTLRVFLLTLAIADDLVAVMLIATLYTEHLRFPMLAGAAVTTAVLAAMGRWRTAPYAFWAFGACCSGASR